MLARVMRYTLVFYWVLLTVAAYAGHASKIQAILANKPPPSELPLLGFFIIGVLFTWLAVREVG